MHIVIFEIKNIVNKKIYNICIIILLLFLLFLETKHNYGYHNELLEWTYLNELSKWFNTQVKGKIIRQLS